MPEQTDALSCKHDTIFRESLPHNSKWYCRTCFTEITDMTRYQN